MFLTDLARVFFYTKEYIDKYNPIGKETGTGNKAAGAYGLGPYILKEGFALGRAINRKIGSNYSHANDIGIKILK
ncbi:MAG: hypothetical protein U5K55_03475 [Aliarcobacter sp.]|nr:hypothetical protein [Aliarcobacter sp.]